MSPNAAWTDKSPKGWLYSDKTGTFDGVQQFKLRPGEAGRSAVQVKAKDLNLSTPVPVGLSLFAQDPKLTVQLFNTEGVCWSMALAQALLKAESLDEKAIREVTGLTESPTT